MPERPKLKIMEKVPQYPPGLRAPKMQKRLRYMRGPENTHNTLLYKQYGIIVSLCEMQYSITNGCTLL